MIQRILTYLRNTYTYKCPNCNDESCMRRLKATSQGSLYVVNHFTCGKTKEIIRKGLEDKLNIKNCG